jgi:hypothetical protein
LDSGFGIALGRKLGMALWIRRRFFRLEQTKQVRGACMLFV